MARKPKFTPLPETPNVPDAQREALSLWMKERMQQITEGYEERIETLRTIGEHPSPIMAKFVRTFAGLHLPMKYIAALCNSTAGTIEKYYQEELDLGRAEVVAMVATNAVRIATSTLDPAASKVALAILDRMGGDEWKPPTKRVEMGELAKPRTLDTSKLSYEERQALRDMMLKMAGQQGQLEQDDGGGDADIG